MILQLIVKMIEDEMRRQKGEFVEAEEEQEQYFAQMLTEIDRISQMKTATRIGMEKGIEDGLEQGIEQGKEQVRKQVQEEQQSGLRALVNILSKMYPDFDNYDAIYKSKCLVQGTIDEKYNFDSSSSCWKRNSNRSRASLRKRAFSFTGISPGWIWTAPLTINLRDNSKSRMSDKIRRET